MLFMDLYSPEKGCVSDSSLFGVSRLNRLMDEDAADKYQCVLLGDNAYPCLRYVMTPIINCKSLSVCMYVYVCVCVCLLGDNKYACLRYVMTPIINRKSLSLSVCVCVCVCTNAYFLGITPTRALDM